jgi:hypothetical protein
MPIVVDVWPIAALLGALSPAKAVTHGALSVVPLVTSAAAEPGWLTLAEAGARATITEVSENGSVPDLKIANATHQPLLLLDGEELVGARQNRILNTSVLVPARSELTIPVSCVEAGRWDYRGRHLVPGGASLYASIRRKKADWVSRSIRHGRGHVSDQSGIWEDLADKSARHGVASPTGAMRDFYCQHDDQIAAARAALAPVVGQIGALVYVSGEWLGGDVLASPGLFATAWARLCPGYVAEAIGARGTRLPRPRPSALLRRIERCPIELVQAIGLGREYRLMGPRATGAVLVAEERVAHLTVFPGFGAAGGATGPSDH